VKKNQVVINMAEIKTASRVMQQIRAEADERPNDWGWELPWEDFAVAASVLTPQSYGGRIAKRLASELGLSTTDDKDRGDYASFKKDYFEVKGSMITSSNGMINLVQIRPWHDVNYIIYCFDIRNINSVSAEFFYLTKSEMENEMIKCGTASAHGTTVANSNNTNRELALRLDIGSSHHTRWETDYSISVQDLELLLK
jgi:hypothetical protein